MHLGSALRLNLNTRLRRNARLSKRCSVDGSASLQLLPSSIQAFPPSYRPLT